jgi:putative endonuclease
MSSTKKQLLGRIGEDAVTRRYAEMGFTVKDRNVHMSHNEIDLILQSATHLVFVEVKTRHAVPGVRSRFGRPADAVNKAKRTRVVEAAKAYLRDNPTSLQPRIDVAEVYVNRCADGSERITDILIFPNAFGAR